MKNKKQRTSVCIEEHISQEFEIVHSLHEDPLELAIKKYYAGELVLAPGEVTCRKMAVTAPECDLTEWKEF